MLRVGNLLLLLDKIIYAILSVIELLIIFRIILIFFSANDIGFAKFIYNNSLPLGTPFYGIFKYHSFQIYGHLIELESVIAIILYSIIGWAISLILSIFVA